MTRRCTVCAHRKKTEIDAALVSGEPYRSIVQRFALSPDSVYRHKARHLPAELAQAESEVT